MKTRRTVRVLEGAALAGALTGWAAGDVVVFYNPDDWASAVESFTTIDFTEFPTWSPITEQYADLGVHFTAGDGFIISCPDTCSDGAAFFSYDGVLELVFSSPQSWLAVERAGLAIDLFRGEAVVYSGTVQGEFAGLVSTELFDRAVVFDSFSLTLDNLYFGPGSGCPWDLDGSAQVAVNDLLVLLAQWGTDPSGPPDFDGDGIVGIADFLELLANWGTCSHFLDCNGNGIFDLVDLDDATSQDCNSNASPDECDVTEGSSPDFNGNTIPDECEAAPNDTCENATAIFDGATPVLTFGATTEWPVTVCEGVSEFFHNDIWFIYTAPCTGTATFSFCNDADFDTLLAVYFSGNCTQVLNPLACSNNAAGCGQTSEVHLLVAEGIAYLLRVGGEEAGGGFGILTITCGPEGQ